MQKLPSSWFFGILVFYAFSVTVTALVCRPLLQQLLAYEQTFLATLFSVAFLFFVTVMLTSLPSVLSRISKH